MTMDMKQVWQNFISVCADMLEIYFFPALLVYVIIQNALLLIYHRWPQLLEACSAFDTGVHGTDELLVVIRFIKVMIIILFNITVVLALLARKKIIHRSTRLREIVLPLIVVHFWALLNLAAFLPKYFIFLVVPQRVSFLLATVGITFDIIGWVICLVAVYQLRHSFSIFVKVHPLMRKGMYSIVRHPIYLGYILVAIGLTLAMPSILTIIMTVIYVWLTVVRARMEEERLLQFHPEYDEYMRLTPMFIPRLK